MTSPSSRVFVEPQYVGRPRVEGPRVVLAGDRLAHLRSDRVVVRALADGAVLGELPLVQSRGVAWLADGALVGFDEDSRKLCRAEVGKAPECHPALLPLPRRGVLRLFGDPVSPRHFWAAGDGRLRRSSLDFATVALDNDIDHALDVGSDLPAIDLLTGGASFAALHGGLDVISADKAGARRHVELPGGATWTLARGGVAGEVWVGFQDALARFDISGAAGTELARCHLDGPRGVHTIASSAQAVAAVLVQHGAGAPRWQVVVWAPDGSVTFQAELPWQPSIAEADVSLALSDAPARVVAASADRVVAWDLAAKGAVLFDF